ncbi:aminoglycoside phosphotransferase family protein [Paenibacillus aurantius]|uniref:Aminoglycoside phosphotransferase family protein n=1 Tax=Paenibacillus aurantius TaxID=2918900 RepID=A0AA96L9S6_9BACL|nr:aminoglycoside phosphotransferase family protein [Paenibacillus aurantius]WNQ09651.1 aminoglycoside phosphotransferase family protein [Paenibacillus aurantius]
MSQLLGRPVIAFRYVRIHHDSHSGRKEAFFLLESFESSLGGLQPNEKWVGIEEISGLKLDHYGIIQDYLLEVEKEAEPEHRQPWERSGWYTKAATWIGDSLRKLGIQLTEPPEQVKWWSLSCVLRLVTTHGNVYFKTNAQQPLFTQELAFLTYMAGIFPNRVPIIMASEPAEGWMLLADAGDKLSRDISVEQRIELLRAFGEIQLGMVDRTAELLGLGCADRRPERVLPLVEPLLEDKLVVSKLTPEELGDLYGHLPVIIDMCKRISAYAVPTTLVHGDLHMGNAAISNGRITFFDWTDACLAHPFMDMILIYQEKDLLVRPRLRDAYLELWTGFESMERLQELWSICEIVHAIHHTISYQSILHHTEVRARSELGGAPSFHLRTALRYLSKG